MGQGAGRLQPGSRGWYAFWSMAVIQGAGMNRMRCIAFLLLMTACGPVDQERVRTLAALEVVPRDDADRRLLVEIFRRHALAAGFHVDDVSKKWQEFERTSSLPASFRSSFNVGVWQGTEDEENQMLADDRGHIGRIWITFPKGTGVGRATRFREALIADIDRHWPARHAIPILPTGGLPLAKDLILVGETYRIRPEARQRYLPADRPLL